MRLFGPRGPEEPALTLRFALFVFDCLRFSFLLNLLAGFIVSANPAGFEVEGLRFPYMVYAAPNALFPLMSLFLLIRLAASRAFVPLYISGKAIAAAALAAWIVVNSERRELFLWALFLGAADIATAVSAALIGTARNGKEETTENALQIDSEGEQ
jgi:hypothetical protein